MNRTGFSSDLISWGVGSIGRRRRCSRHGLALSVYLRTNFVLDALDQAINARSGDDPLTGLVHHSDRGTQYLSFRYHAPARGCDWLRESRKACTVLEAQNARRRGADVFVKGGTSRQRRELRGKIERGAFRNDPGAGRVILHPRTSPVTVPIYRRAGSDLLGGIVDFVNPIRDIQDVIDVVSGWPR